MSFDFQKMFAGKTVVLLGAGISNMPLAKVLIEAGAHLIVRDRKELQALGEAGKCLRDMGAKMILGEDYLENIKGDFLFRSRDSVPICHSFYRRRIGAASLLRRWRCFWITLPVRWWA